MFWDDAEKETSSIPTTRSRDAQTRSFNCVLPLLRAQWPQQKICPSASTPCPTIRQLQCAQTGASAWIAHSKLSKVWCFPSTTTSNALSYSFSQTSHVGISQTFRISAHSWRCANRLIVWQLRVASKLCAEDRHLRKIYNHKSWSSFLDHRRHTHTGLRRCARSRPTFPGSSLPRRLFSRSRNR